MNRTSARPPQDHALPGSELLFDLDALRMILGAPHGAALRLRYVEHSPGESALVLVALDARLVAISVGRTAPADAGLQVAWYPDDPALPGLRDGWAGLLAALGLPTGDPERLTWVPHRRLVAANGDLIIKLHQRGDETEQAVSRAATVRTVVPVPDVLRVDADRAVHVQRRVVGRPLERDDAEPGIDAACELLHRLLTLDPAGLVRHAPSDLLAHCRQVAQLVGFIAPHTTARLDVMISRLDDAQPMANDVVAAHGDFNVGQLLRRGDGELVVVDTDTLCAASAAYDPASYAANLIAGRPGDLDDARRVLRRFGQQLAQVDDGALDWYLAAMVLRRLDRGLRRYKRDWPARTNRLVDDAEQLVGLL
ncbi:MAG: phosphotransferase family protein [Acidimicrobiales bacterium]